MTSGELWFFLRITHFTSRCKIGHEYRLKITKEKSLGKLFSSFIVFGLWTLLSSRCVTVILHSGRSVCWLLVGPFCHHGCMNRLQPALVIEGVAILGRGFVLSSLWYVSPLMVGFVLPWVWGWHALRRTDRPAAEWRCVVGVEAEGPWSSLWLERFLRDVEHRLLKNFEAFVWPASRCGPVNEEEVIRSLFQSSVCVLD